MTIVDTNDVHQGKVRFKQDPLSAPSQLTSYASEKNVWIWQSLFSATLEAFPTFQWAIVGSYLEFVRIVGE